VLHVVVWGWLVSTAVLAVLLAVVVLVQHVRELASRLSTGRAARPASAESRPRQDYAQAS
jgi:hypothetical protein